MSKVRVVATLWRGNRRSQMDCGEVVAIATTFMFLDPRSAASRYFQGAPGSLPPVSVNWVQRG